MSFLTNAHKQGALRQAGAVYQFRHIELQYQLANRGLAAIRDGAPLSAPDENGA